MNLKEALKKKEFVVTSEVQTPYDEDPEGLIQELSLVRGRVDGVRIREVGVGGIIERSIRGCEVLKRHQFEPIYQTTTRDKSRIELQKDFAGAYEAGVENLLVFTEDYRITGDSLQELMFFHVDLGKLESVLTHLREGQTVDGRELPFKADFTLGSGVESGWEKQIPDMELKEMEELTKAGAGFFLTTPVFDLERFEKFIKATNTFGVPVIAEVMVIRSAGMGRFLNTHLRSGMVPDWALEKLTRSPDRHRASVELFADTVKGLKELCQGVHIITIGGESRLKDYLDAARLL